MATNLASILQTLKSSVASQLPSTYQKPDYTNVIDPRVLSFSELQNQLGSSMQYDADSIKKLYQDATNSAYESSKSAQTASERAFWQSLSNLQNTSTDALRNTESSAIASGTNKGMSAANQLSAILGLQEEGLTQSTDLVNNRQQIASDYASQLSQDAKDALGTSNDFQAQLATLMRQLYADQQTQQAAQLAYNQSINSDNAGYSASYDTAYASLMDAIAGAGSEIYGYDAAYGTNAGAGSGYTGGSGLSTGSGTSVGSLTGDSTLGSTLARSQQGINAQTQNARASQPASQQNQLGLGLTAQLRGNPVAMGGLMPSFEQLAGTIPTDPMTEEEKRRRRLVNGAQARPASADYALTPNVLNKASIVKAPDTVTSLPSNPVARGATGSASVGYLAHQQDVASQRNQFLSLLQGAMSTTLDKAQQGVAAQTSAAKQNAPSNPAVSAAVSSGAAAANQSNQNSAAVQAAVQAAAAAAKKPTVTPSIAAAAQGAATAVKKPSTTASSAAVKAAALAAAAKKKASSSTAASQAARGY